MLNDMNISREWLLRMAEKEGNGIISVGGLVCDILQGERESMQAEPAQTFTTTTATSPREGEAVGEFEETSYLRETLAAERSVSDGLSMACCKLKVEAVELRAELAKRDAEIVVRKRDRDHLKAENAALNEQIHNQVSTIARQVAELAKRDEELAKAKVIDRALRTESQRRMGEITSLRSQLARAGAIERLSRFVVERLSPDAFKLETRAAIDRLKALFGDFPGPEADEPAGPASGFPFTCITCGNGVDQSRVCQECKGRSDIKDATSPVIDASGSLDGNHTHGAFVEWSDEQRKAAVARHLIRIVIEEVSPGLWKPAAWEGDRRLVSWEASTRESIAETVLAAMRGRDDYRGIKL